MRLVFIILGILAAWFLVALSLGLILGWLFRTRDDTGWMDLADATRERRPTPAETALADGPDFTAWEAEYQHQNRGRP